MWLPRFLFFVMMLGAAVGARGDATTRSTDGVKAEEIRQSLAGLTDADPAVREKAFAWLLGLGRDDLDLLRSVVKASRPLAPSQAAALKDIVQHVYLSGQEYEKAPRGFLGIIMMRVSLDQKQVGIVVESRMPGFCGFRALRDGDLVLDVDDLRLPQPLDQEVFTDAIKEYKPGQEVKLKVLRAGKVMQVAVRLDARPTDEALQRDGGPEGFADRRLKEAETYWKQTFATMLESDDGAVR
jgi:hypothetical protein